jgi:hypothetical protein
LQGRFEGSGWRLFLRGFLMWLLLVGPIVAAIAIALRTANWSALPDILASRGNDKELGQKLVSAGFFYVLIAAGIAINWAMFAAAILYPAFQALVWRWWASGLRFGEIEITSKLRTRRVYGIYFRFLGYSILFSLAVGVIGVIVNLIVAPLFRGLENSEIGQIATAAGLLVSYVVIALGISTIYQVVVRAGMWKAISESLEISNLSALDKVSARGAPGSPLGEGLADALNVGGI